MSEEALGRLLLVEDDEMSRDMLSRRLRRRRYEVVAVDSGPAALARLEREAFDLVLLDWMMPGMTGLQVLAQPRERWSPSQLPVIMVTARAEADDLVEALGLGANDYVTKPVQLDVAVARIGTHVALKRSEERLRREAILDPLTGLYNRRHLMERLETELESARRYHHRLSCLMWDLDHYKAVNDRHGHRAGDDVLAFVGAVMREQARCSDVAARYGGDEFLVLFPHTDAQGAARFADRLRRRLAATTFTGREGTFRVGASFGVAEYDPDTMDAQAFLEAADRALYRAKAAGRDRIALATAHDIVLLCATPP